MNSYTTPVVASLLGIVITGIFGIRLVVELGVSNMLIYISYIGLAVFILLIPISVKGIRWGFLVNILMAGIVLTVNTITAAHMNIVFSLDPVYNAVILIIGSYVLQPILLISSLRAFRFYRNNK